MEGWEWGVGEEFGQAGRRRLASLRSAHPPPSIPPATPPISSTHRLEECAHRQGAHVCGEPVRALRGGRRRGRKHGAGSLAQHQLFGRLQAKPSGQAQGGRIEERGRLGGGAAARARRGCSRLPRPRHSRPGGPLPGICQGVHGQHGPGISQLGGGQGDARVGAAARQEGQPHNAAHQRAARFGRHPHAQADLDLGQDVQGFRQQLHDRGGGLQAQGGEPGRARVEP